MVLTCRKRVTLQFSVAAICHSFVSFWLCLFNQGTFYIWSVLLQMCLQPTYCGCQYVFATSRTWELSTNECCLQCRQVTLQNCTSSVYPIIVGTAGFQGMTTMHSSIVCFWWSVAAVLLAEQVPDGERSLPGFYSLPLFSHRSWE